MKQMHDGKIMEETMKGFEISFVELKNKSMNSLATKRVVNAPA